MPARRHRSLRAPLVLSALLFVAAPHLAAQRIVPDGCGTGTGRKASSSSINDGNGPDDMQRTIRWADGDCELTLRSRGDVEVTPALDDIARIGARGWVEVEERNGDVVRRFEARERDGRIERRWSLDGDATRFDVDRKKWLGQVLLVLERRTGAFAKTRVPALLKSGGVNALLDESANLEGDYARGIYLRAALEQPTLDDRGAARVVGVVETQMKSDYERGQVLRALAARKQPMSDAVASALVRVARSMSSDYEKRRALAAVITSVGAARVRPALYDAASTIGSDYERAELLVAAEKGGGVEAKDRDAYFRAIGRFSSDYERKRVLTSLIAERPSDPAVLRDILRATAGMKSDYERGEVLRAFAAAVAVKGDLREEYLTSAKQMKSDYEYRRVLQALVGTERSF